MRGYRLSVCRQFLSSAVELAQLFLCLLVSSLALHAQNPVASWNFSEGAGAKVADSSGYSHPADLTNGISWVITPFGNAVSASVSHSQYMRVPAIDLSRTRGVTVALWVKRSYSMAGGHVLLEASADYNRSITGFALLPDDQACHGIQVAMRGDVGYTANCYEQPSSEVWHHLAVVFDKSQSAGEQVKFYIDGKLQSPSRNLFAATNTNEFGNNPIYVFSRGGTQMFDSGAISDFRIYDSALTTGKIQQLYSATYDAMASSGMKGIFSLSVSPTSLSIAQGKQGTSTIKTLGMNGFNSAISLSASGVPSGTTVSFSPNPIAAPGSGTSTMSVAVGSNTTVGTYPITVTSNGGGVQQTAKLTLTVTPGSGGGISLDGNAHGAQDNGYTASNTAAVSVGTPTAGDLITCEVTFDSGGGNTLVSVTDSSNGAYTPAVPIYLDPDMQQWFGIYYRQNVAGSATTATLKTSQSRPYAAISCQAWKGVATANALDSGFVQSRNAVGVPNPTTGANRQPAGNGELIIAAAALLNSGTPVAGGNYTLIDAAPTTRWWPEYWIQTTATPTAGNYTWPTDTWTDLMAAFLPAASSNFAISASPTALSVAQGGQGASTISTTISGGFNSALTLSASGVPNGTTVSFSPNPIAAPGNGSSNMTITVGGNTAVGTYPITVTGSGGSLQHSATVTLTVTAIADFTLAAAPTSLTMMQGQRGGSTISTTVSGGFNSAISLSASGVPNGTTVSFSPNPIAAPGSGSSYMTITVGGNTALGTYPITVTGSGGSSQHSSTVMLTVTDPPDYAIAANPLSLSVAQGQQGSSTISTTINGGFSSAISLSAGGVPNGTTVSFNPNPIAAPGNGSSSMTITVGGNTAVGTYPITVTGNGGGIQHSTTVTLTVTATLTGISYVQGNYATPDSSQSTVSVPLQVGTDCHRSQCRGGGMGGHQCSG